MDSEPYIEDFDRSCGKNVYSHNQVERMRIALGRGRGKDLRAYECNKCFGWHLTKKNGKQNIADGI